MANENKIAHIVRNQDGYYEVWFDGEYQTVFGSEWEAEAFCQLKGRLIQ